MTGVERYVDRCLSGVVFDNPRPELGWVEKRCCLPDHHGDTDHLWVEATNDAGTALVVRWDGPRRPGNTPREVLVAS